MNNQSVWQRLKHNPLTLMIVSLIFGGLIACVTEPSGTGSTNTVTPTHASPTPTLAATLTTFTALEDDASRWGIFYDGGSARAKLENVVSPSVDGTALKIALISGQPYAGIHAYRNLPPDNTATHFDLNLSFYLPSVAPSQALEFTMNTWINNQRWEWALQWEHIGDGTPQQGNPPTWRLWTGQGGWQDTKLRQQLSVKTWHKFHLKGDIINGQVHYLSFSCDDISKNLGQTFAPVSSTGDKLAVAVQLDGNSHEDPYQVYIDGVDLRWS